MTLKTDKEKIPTDILINRIAGGIFTTIMIYFIVAGSSGILIWFLGLFKLVVKYQYWTTAKPGWGWVVQINSMIQRPRYWYAYTWAHHKIITSFLTYVIASIIIFAMNYSEKDTEESEEKLLQKVKKIRIKPGMLKVKRQRSIVKRKPLEQ